MQRRLLACIVCLMMVVTTACGGASQSGGTAASEAPAEESEKEEKDSAEAEAGDAENKGGGTVLIDTDDCFVEYKGVSEQSDDRFWSMDFYIENHTDSEIRLMLRRFLVNDCLIGVSSGDVIKVPANGSVDDESNHIDLTKVQYYKIDNIDSLRFELEVVNPDSGDTVCSVDDISVTENLPVPSSQKRPGEYETVIYEGDDVSIKTSGVYYEDTDRMILNVFIDNNSDYSIGVEFPNMKVNGQDIQTANAYTYMPSHSKCSSAAYRQYVIRGEDLTALGIQDIETLSFDIAIEHETVKRNVTIDNKGNILETEEPVETEEPAEQEEAAPSDEQETPAEEMPEEQDAEEPAEEETPDSGIDGIIIDESAWEEWKNENKVALMTFLKATSTAGVTWDINSGQKNSQHKVGYILEDHEKVDGIEMYYAVENQDVYYVGLNAVDEDMFHSDEFKDYCAAFLRGYTAASGEELTMSEERAREIVDYAIDNNQRCVADGVRIRINEIDGGYGFHMEY